MSKSFQPGERLSAKRLNLHSAANAQVDLGSAAGSMSRFGSSVANVQHDLAGRGIWVRVLPNSVREATDTTGGGQRVVKSYGWEAIHLLDITESGKARKWARNPAVFGTKDVDPVFASDLGNLTPSEDGSLDYANASRPTLTPYLVARDPVSQRLIVVGGGGGSFSASGKDMVLMILGDYNAYKDCPGVPADPPKDENGNFCWPPYAWAAYKVCGYQYTKLFDMRGFGQWALELNGGGTGSYRRFFPAFWGWDTFTDGYDPTGSVDCAGVRFIGYNSQGALTCTCPTWLDNMSCIKLEFTTPPRPENPLECVGGVGGMDNYDSWDKTIQITLCNTGTGICSFQGVLDNFSVDLSFYGDVPISSPECNWGPSTFDPCDPCAEFGRFFLCIDVDGGSEPNCGSGCHYTGYFKISQLKSLYENCDTGNGTLSISPYEYRLCNNCGNNQTPPEIYHFINGDSVVLKCCSSTEVNSCVQSAGV